MDRFKMTPIMRGMMTPIIDMHTGERLNYGEAFDFLNATKPLGVQPGSAQPAHIPVDEPTPDHLRALHQLLEDHKHGVTMPEAVQALELPSEAVRRMAYDAEGIYLSQPQAHGRGNRPERITRA